jgi:DNA-directed RNA polymerase subunit RPC12/RpoP
MAGRLTIEQVKEAFAAANFELLASGYESSKQPLEYSCKVCGYKGTTRLEYVKAGNGCPRCWQARRGQSQKHDLEFVREKFAARRLELLERSYPGSKTPLSFRCTECGFRGKLRFNDLSNGSGCRECGIRRRASSRKLDFDAFKRDMEKKGIEVLSSVYVNSNINLQLRCMKCKRHWKARPNDLRRAAVGCPRCGHKRGGRMLAYSQEKIVQKLAKLRITLLSAYERSQKPLRVRFEQCGHAVLRTWNEIQRGVGCPKCAPNIPPTAKEYRAIAARYGGVVLQIAKTSNRHSIWRCSLGHVFRRPFISIKELDTFCTVCSGAYAEMLSRMAVEGLFEKPFQRIRIAGMKSLRGRPLELDMYNDDLKIAVEHHGAQHYKAVSHWAGKEGLRTQRLHDQRRRKFCRENGILLIEVRQLGERTSLEQMRQQIREALVGARRKIPARFDTAKLTNLPRVNASQVYWSEVQRAARTSGLEIAQQKYFGSAKPLSVRCSHGHISLKTPRSILEGHGCDDCYMERIRRPLQLSDRRMFASGTAAAKALGVRKETVNKAALNGWTVKGFGIKRISWEEFRTSLTR